MSNESENRIDLTQFKGMTEGPWESEEWDEGKILGPISERHNNSHPVVAVVGDGWWGDLMVECNANKRAMTAVPDLIAELKKLYEFMDLHQICGCGAICPNMNKETWARVKRCGFCEPPSEATRWNTLSIQMEVHLE